LRKANQHDGEKRSKKKRLRGLLFTKFSPPQGDPDNVLAVVSTVLMSRGALTSNIELL